jgi:hypothetical protein
MLLHSDNLSVARPPFKRACSLASRFALPVLPTYSPFSRYTQRLAQEGLGILLAAWNVSQMAPASMMSSMISVQVRVFCAVFFSRQQQPAGASLVSSSLPSRQVLPLVSPFASASPLNLPLRHRSALFSKYNIMVSGAVSVQPPLGDIPCYFRLSAQVAPKKKIKLDWALYCEGAGVPRNKRLRKAGCGCAGHCSLHATVRTVGQRLR